MRERSLFVLLLVASCGGQGKPGVAIPPTDLPGVPGIPSPPSATGPAAPPAVPPAPPPTKPANAHRRCAWIQYGDDVGYDTFAAHAAFFDAIHPDWYQVAADGVSLTP